ncbi:hypothetical protein AO057_16815 [Curvibacter sp. PAE-UM]|nr:hypothetical protein AO057_16815 [Curvibacter sp. PAE-UM]
MPAAKITEILDVLKQAINSASRYIYVEDQTLNPAPLEVSAGYNKHDDLSPAISAACARGVKVIFVCWDGMTGSVGPSVSSQIVEKILDPLTAVQRQNFALYWLAGNRLHSKLFIVDDEFASIGAANFWDRSMQGTESELNAAYVCTAGSNSQVASLRVKLWSEHLRLTPAVAVSVEAELRNLDKSLGIFRTAWATSSLSFSSPGSVLREIVS